MSVVLRLVLRRRGMAAVRFVESEPVALTPRGWTKTVTIEQVAETSGGSTQVLRSETYNFKEKAANEADKLKEADVRRGARRRCLDKFDDAKAQRKRQKRKEARQEKAAAAAAEVARARADALPPLAAAAAVPPPDPSFEPDEVETRRDWALLRAWKVLPSAEAVLESLRMNGLDDEDEPWTVCRVRERHAFLCRCVRHASRLVGESGSVRTVRTLACLCA